MRLVSRARPAALVCALVFACVAPGCIGALPTYPPKHGYPTVRDPSGEASVAVLSKAMQWTVRRYPPMTEDGPVSAPSEPYAINLPAGITREAYLEVVDRVGPFARAMSGENVGLATYHVSRFSTLGSEAKVEVYRPIDLDGEGYERLTLWLEGRDGVWTVTRHKLSRRPSRPTLPDMYFVPDEPEDEVDDGPAPDIARPDAQGAGPRRGE